LLYVKKMKDEIIIQKNELGNIKSSLDYFLKFNTPKNARILDVGCNYGSLIYNMYRLGYKNIYGIDINKQSIKQGRKSYKHIRTRLKAYDGNEMPFKDETFDVILMFDVIEHILNIEKFLKEQVYRILKKGGIFIFQTPNKPLNIIWEIINKKSFTKYKEYHYSLQTYSSLRKLLEHSGFNSIEIERYNTKSKHNKNKVKAKLGFIGSMLLDIISIMPLRLQSNFWGSGRR
jgi:2-polyprenyl-3-methyl-5-hydroxy-6-metoxy-1,4-benzoquinol methylase